MRWMMTRVLPLPAPARTKTGPRVVVTASRCRGLSELSRFFTDGVRFLAVSGNLMDPLMFLNALKPVKSQTPGPFMPQMNREELQHLLQQEFPQSEVVVEAVGPYSSVVRIPIQEHHLRPGGTVSGPTMMLLADTAMYVAILSYLQHTHKQLSLHRHYRTSKSTLTILPLPLEL